MAKRTGLDDGPTAAEVVAFKKEQRKAALCERAKRQLGPMYGAPAETKGPQPDTNPSDRETMPLLRETIRRVQALEAALIKVASHGGISSSVLTIANTEADRMAARIRELEEGDHYLRRLFRDIAPDMEQHEDWRIFCTQIDSYIVGLRDRAALLDDYERQLSDKDHEIEQLSRDRWAEQRAKDSGARIVADMAEKAGGCPIDQSLCDDAFGCGPSGGETCPMAALSAALEPDRPVDEPA